MFKVENGKWGGLKNMIGGVGSDCLIEVFFGMMIYDGEIEELLGDLVKLG